MNFSEIILAVLPFQSENRKIGTIGQNFEEDLVYHLSKFQGFSVLSYYTTGSLTISDEEALKKYQVSHIVTGAFRKRDEQTLVINVQLIQFPEHKIIYDQRVAYQEEDVFALMDQAVGQVTNVLQKQLNHAILSNSYKKPLVNLEAYELLLLGNAHLKKGTPEDDVKAREFYERAIAKQPDYSRAFSGISSSYFNQWSCQLWDRWEISQQGAKRYALKAIELDENDYLSLSILSRVLLFERDFDQAEFYLRKSLEMNSNDPNTLLEMAFSLVFLGHADEAFEIYEHACQLNPLKEDKYQSVAATIKFEQGEYRQALDIGKRLETSATYIDFPVYMGASAYYLGKEEDALAYWQQFLNKFDGHIYFHDKTSPQDPLDWHIGINPYRKATRLTAFHHFIREKYGSQTADKAPRQSGPSTGRFHISTSHIEIHYADQSVRMNKTKGLIDISKLLERPYQDFHSMELMGVRESGSKGVTILDAQSKKEYQERILELQQEMEEAESLSNAIKYETLSEEYDRLIAHLSKSLGLQGESRKVGSTADKARAAVTMRIRDSIKKITAENAVLGAHLTNSIKTGLLCCYRPEVAVDWHISTL